MKPYPIIDAVSDARLSGGRFLLRSRENSNMHVRARLFLFMHEFR